jgi:hypothetical protein
MAEQGAALCAVVRAGLCAALLAAVFAAVFAAVKAGRGADPRGVRLEGLPLSPGRHDP